MISKTLKMLVKITLLLVSVFGLCNCGLEESYKDFHVEIIDDYEEKDYYNLDKLDFAKVGNVIVVPCIYATNHGEYTVKIEAYSQTGDEQITVKSVHLRDNENTFYIQEVEQKVVFKESQENIFLGQMRGGVFYETDTDLSNNKKIFVTVLVQVEKDGQKEIKELNYEITVIQYMSHVMPT